MLLLFVILLLVMVSNTFIRYLSQAAAGSMSPGAVINLISFTVPNLIVTLLPICFFLSIVLSYGKLFADNELLVMFACGMRWRWLMKITLMIAIIVAIIVAVLSFWLVPKMLSSRDSLKANASGQNQISTVQPGRFILANNGTQVVYVGQITDKKTKMHKLFMFQEAEGSSPPKVTVAPRGHKITDQKTGQSSIVLENGHQYTGSPGHLDYQTTDFQQYTVPVSVKTISQQDERVTSMSTKALFVDGSTAAWAEIMWRISQPVSVFVVCLMGVALCRVRPRAGRFQKLLPAVLIFIVYFNLLAAARSWTTLGVVPMWLSIWWVHALFALISILVIWNYDGRRWIRRDVK